MVPLAVHRQQVAWLDPIIEDRQFVLGRMARGVELGMLVLIEEGDAELTQGELQALDQALVARNRLGREDHAVAGHQLEMGMTILRQSRQRSARLALAAGGDHQHLFGGQVAEITHRHQRRQVIQIAEPARHADHAFHGASHQAYPAAGASCRTTHRQHPRQVAGEAADDHPSGAVGQGTLECPGDVALAARMAGQGGIGGVADHQVDRRQRLEQRRIHR